MIQNTFFVGLFGLAFIAGEAAWSEDSRLVRETPPLSPEQEIAALRVAPGFEVRLFAAEPQINKPINMAFDEQGRLWVSSTAEYPFAAERERWSDASGTKVRGSRDAVKILEDTDGDGRADKVTDFATGLNIPTGVIPWKKEGHRAGCIAWSIPNIWYFADTTGDGVCDLRKIIFGPLGYEKDTHGMCSSFRLGPEGWIFGTHGFNNTSVFRPTNGLPVELHSGNVYRFRPDGSQFEIWSRGQVNPFGLCFDRLGNLYSADCHSAPVYQLLRGAVYPSFRKPHDGIGFGPAMIEHSHGSTGICGIVYIDDGRWGKEWDDCVLIGNPVTSRINADRIEFRGTTPRAVELNDFLISDDPWFRPVDLQLAPDGALYVADFYNRIIGHYEVPLDHPGRDRERGRIWRITKKKQTIGNANRDLDLRGHRPGPNRVPSPIEPSSIDDLRDASPFVQRRAAAWFQEHPEKSALPELIKLLETAPDEDTHLRHVVKMAVREHLKLAGAFSTLPRPPESTSLAEIALAVPSEDSADYLLTFLETGSPDAVKKRLPILKHAAAHATKETVSAMLTRERNHFGDDLLFQVQVLDAIQSGLYRREGDATRLKSQGLEWGRVLAGQLLDQPAHDPQATRGNWETETNANGPSPWVLQTRSCADGSEAIVLSSLARGEPKAEQRTGAVRSGVFPAPEKLTFWICGHRGFPAEPAHDKNKVRIVHAKTGRELFSVFPPRSDTCQKREWLPGKNRDEPVRLEIVDGDDGKAYAWLGVTRIEPPLADVETFAETEKRNRALRKLAALILHSAPADLRERLNPWMPPPPQAPPRVVTPEERTRLDSLIAERVQEFSDTGKDADLENGGRVFEKHCAVCHRIGKAEGGKGKGGLTGPQLDGIGKRGVARLCEDILDPNRNVDAHFYITVFAVKDGSATGGSVKNRDREFVYVLDAAGNEHRLQKGSIAKEQTVAMSLMPSGFGSAISKADFADLLAWLIESSN